MKCIYCNHPHTYLLKEQQRKCSKCKRKFSLKKLERESILIKHFIKGSTAIEASIESKMHIVTVHKYYEQFRVRLALFADSKYHQYSNEIQEYDEYLYLPKSLKIEDNIHKLQHFLTLNYHNKIYNIMMPSLERYSYNKNTIQEQKLLIKYLQFNKIAKISKTENTITRFWDYFENFILKYKGISDEQFIYYLKEAECRFNYNKEILYKVLSKELFY